ncbi:redoxin domain-containing protein [Occallatibacter savannae]|uniref:redoxin domain-containing protein n=1 Tax=Occallatibacter savannae TaxID=1002691 RepID=UPI0013A55A89|nr:redoxin domain-containing protein [Occallatibacter savannae]
MHRQFILLLFAALLAGTPASFSEQKTPKKSVYDFSLVDNDGRTVSLSTYRGKVLLVVNLASQSTYRDQISALNDLQNTYGPQGLVVLGIPSSDFGSKELTDPKAVRQYYGDKLHVAFPVFAPAKTAGVEIIPLYSFLCDPKIGVPGGQLHWSFTKFIIGRDGIPLARYEVGEDPQGPAFHLIIEDALGGKLKKTDAIKIDSTAGDQEDRED